jgi:small-conductance mechanosensitive channel
MDINDFLPTLKYTGIFIGISLATILAAYLFNRLFSRFIQKSSVVMQNDPTNYVFLRHAITGIIYVIGFSWAIYEMPSMRAVANSLLAGAGILAVAVGFASQHALGNVVSGLFIVIFKPFRVNDRLILQNGLAGAVEDISLRHVVIRDFENRRILIPNSVISNQILTNSDFNDDRICKWLEFKLHLDTDITQLRSILVEEALKHPLRIDRRTPEDIEAGVPEIMVRVIGLNEYFVHVRAYIWTANTADAFALGCDLMEVLKVRFEQEGIRFAMPRHEIFQHAGGSTAATDTITQEKAEPPTE